MGHPVPIRSSQLISSFRSATCNTKRAGQSPADWQVPDTPQGGLAPLVRIQSAPERRIRPEVNDQEFAKSRASLDFDSALVLRSSCQVLQFSPSLALRVLMMRTRLRFVLVACAGYFFSSNSA